MESAFDLSRPLTRGTADRRPADMITPPALARNCVVRLAAWPAILLTGSLQDSIPAAASPRLGPVARVWMEREVPLAIYPVSYLGCGVDYLGYRMGWDVGLGLLMPTSYLGS